MEDVKRAKTINYAAIAEMSTHEGWKILEDMLSYDVRFALGLLTRGKSPKPTQENPHPDPVWITEPHDIGRARATLANAQKYLDLVRISRERNQTS